MTIDIGILSMKKEEYDAVCAALGPVRLTRQQRRSYATATVGQRATASIEVAVTRCEQGTLAALTAARDIVLDFRPKLLLVVGIAGAFPDAACSLGDVVLSTRVYDLRVRREKGPGVRQYSILGGPLHGDVERHLLPILGTVIETISNWAIQLPPRPTIELTPDRFLGSPSWNARVQGALEALLGRSTPTPQVSFGGICSSDSNVQDSELASEWQDWMMHSRAIEMESAGVYEACRGADIDQPFLSIRGISDVVGYRRTSQWTEYACHSAARFAIALLRFLADNREFLPQATAATSIKVSEQRVQFSLPPTATNGSRVVTIERSGRQEWVGTWPVRYLRGRLDNAIERRARLLGAGSETFSVDTEIAALKRELRDGGQLRAGDALGEGRYTLIERVGLGGFATVWRAFDEELRIPVAVKVLHSGLASDPWRVARFLRGARVMRSIGHEAVVAILQEPSNDQGWHFFVMEYLEGGDLENLVRSGRFPATQAWPLLLRLCEPLALAHARGIVHRDLKPANIVFDSHGIAKLTDFDLVSAGDTTGGTRSGALGTFRYTAPEALDNAAMATPASDVYSLGMITLFSLLGRDIPVPLIGDEDGILLQLGLAHPLSEVLRRAISWRHPELRYSSATHLREAAMVALASGSNSPSDGRDAGREVPRNSEDFGTSPEKAIEFVCSVWELPLAEALVEAITRCLGEGYPLRINTNADLWFDSVSRDAMVSQLKSSSAVMTLLTTRSVRQGAVVAHLGAAAALGKTLLLVFATVDEYESAPSFLSQAATFTLRDVTTFQELVQGLAGIAGGFVNHDLVRPAFEQLSSTLERLLAD